MAHQPDPAQLLEVLVADDSSFSPFLVLLLTNGGLAKGYVLLGRIGRGKQHITNDSTKSHTPCFKLGQL